MISHARCPGEVGGLVTVHMSEQATFAKRIHHQWQPDILEIELSVDDDIKNSLKEMGYFINFVEPRTCIQTIMYQNGEFTGYGDFRRPDAFASGNINDR